MKLRSLITLGGAIATSATFGQLTFAPDFNTYDEGTLDGQGPFSVGSGNSTFTVTEGGLSYTGGSVNHNGTGQHVAIVGGSNENRASAAFTPQSGDVYFSFLFESTGSGTFLWLGLSDDADFNNSAGAIAGWLPNVENSVLGRMRDGSNQTNSGSAGGWAHGDTYLVVGKLEKSDAAGNYDSLSVLLNPTSLDEPASWDATVTRNIGIAEVSTLLFRVGNNNDFRFNVDMLRVGESFDAVVIPEPRTYAAIAGLLAIAFVLYRRRK
ncbi:MAG: hypothetical protein JJT96_12050 [Opitutales bacterium]|nr:hypothetical protein [Opitutales bacterium]